MTRIKFLNDTYLKQDTAQASTLPNDRKQLVSKGTTLVLSASGNEQNGHFKITLKDDVFKGLNTWFAFADHVDIFDRETITSSSSSPDDEKPLPSEKKLNVPHFDQHDNQFAPGGGSCNVTSCAMVLSYFNIPRRDPSINQFEDELFQFMESKGWDRHDHLKLATVLQEYGIKDRFTTTASWKEIKQHLAQGNPVICAGDFTLSGHIFVISGYDSTGFIVQDPNGEWFSTDYVKNSSADRHRGANQHYSYDMMERLAGPGSVSGMGGVWAHFPRK